MSIAYICVFLAACLPYVLTSLAKLSSGTYGYKANKDPRAWAEALDGRQKRLNNAHLNSFEAFPLFAVSVLVAVQMGANQERIDLCAMGYIATRAVYAFFYAADMPRLRSLTWALGMALVVAIFFAGVWAKA